jgi:excinuclease ABC subunit C
MTDDRTPSPAADAPHPDLPDAAARPTGPAVIAAYVRHLPAAPGVYRMLDTAGEVIYVGKARSLKARVSSYARDGTHTNRIARMISATASMEFVTVRTDAEALLLEANLIKRFRPRYNVVLRDDKSFPFIVITRDHRSPQIAKHRGARGRTGDYFGPFASAGAVNRTINMLQRAFLLRSCSDSVFESVTRPCMLHQIKRCSAPCTGEISAAAYDGLVDEAVRFLRGESQNVRDLYKQMMHEAAEALDFERAASFRNRMWALAHVTADQTINPEGIEEADVIAAHQEGGQTCIQVFFFRTGQNWGNRAYYPKADRSLPVEEVLEAFVAQFYDDKPVPRLILLSHALASQDLLAEALSVKAERRVEIRVPERGAKTGLVAHAQDNARQALALKLAETASQGRLLTGLAERLGLARVPQRVEVYDNSHIMGTNAVGAMIVAGPEGFQKSQYRKFTIKSEAGSAGDDYGMMREVLTRRFKRLVGETSSLTAAPAEGPSASEDQPVSQTRPDLVLIDGGAGQLQVAVDVMAELGVRDIPVVGIAKGPDRDAGREHFHVPGRAQSFMLEPRDPVLYFVQRLRDEAHRFAIGAHRAKRAKAMGVNPLDEIDGIGPTRKRALLAHFGSAKSVSRASVEDLTAVPGISADLARRIYDFFHDRRG